MAIPSVVVEVPGLQGPPGPQGDKGDPAAPSPSFNGASSLVGWPLQIMARGGYTATTYPDTSALTWVLLTPIFADVDCTIDEAAMYVSGGANAEATITLALYQWHQPGTQNITKLHHLGTISAASTGNKSLTFATPLEVPAGRYLVASQTNGYPIQVYGVSSPEGQRLGAVTSGNNILRWPSSYQYGPPFNRIDTPTLQLSDVVNSPAPNVSLRRAS